MFAAFAIDEEEQVPRLPTIEVNSMDQIYELASRDLFSYLVDTPYTTFLDEEDKHPDDPESLEPIVILKYYKHTCDWGNYLEFDARILDLGDNRRLDMTREHFVESMCNAYRPEPNKRFYMRKVAINNVEKTLFHETWVNGLYFAKREQSYESVGR